MNKKIQDNAKPAQVIAITSGKGGVGKTNIAINLALALADKSHKVTLFDADLGLANIDVLLNLRPLRNLSHVIQGGCELNEILIKGPNNIQIIPGASGIRMMNSLSPLQQGQLVHAFEQLAYRTSTLIIDTSSGINDSMIRFCLASQEVMLVVCNDPASVTDTYALIKILARDYGIDHFRIVANRVRSYSEGEALYKRLFTVSSQYLNVVLKLAAIIPYDINLLHSVQQRFPLTLAHPSSLAAIALKKLANEVDKWDTPASADGMLKFFFKQAVDMEIQGLYRVPV